MAPAQVTRAAGPRPYDRAVVLSTWASVIALFLASSAGIVIHKAVPGSATAVRAGATAAGASTTTTEAALAPASAGATSTTAATRAAAAAAPSSPSPKPVAVATAGPATSLGAAQDPGPPSPPRPGVYKQRATTTSNGSTTTSDLTVTIENEASKPELTQRVTISTDKGSSVSELAWRPDAVMLLSNTFGSGANASTCKWAPAIESMPTSMAAGTTWSSDSTCSMSAYGRTETMHETMQAKILRLERISEAGRVIDCWVASRTVHIEGAGVYPFTVDTTTTDWFTPKYGEIAKSETDTKSSGTSNGQTTTSQVHTTTEAVTLDPQ